MLRSKQDYLDSLKRMRPNVHKFGKRIEDVTTDPNTRRTVESHSKPFELADTEGYSDIFTTISYLTGERIMRFNSLMETGEDLIANSRLKRTMYHLTGTCTGGLCVGWNAMNVMWGVTYDMDREKGTDYHGRLESWIIGAEKRGLVVSGALTDAKGDRSRKPSQQKNRDTNLHIRERREDGLIISGCKAMICGVAASDEIFLLPGSDYGEEDKDFALACAVPRDAEGLTVVETRRPSDTRELENGFDTPVETGITQAHLLFDEVFVPTERIFMAGEHQYAGRVIDYFTANYRSCIGACVAGQGDVMIGAAAMMARTNGLPSSTFRDKLVQMEVNNETTYGLGIGAIAMGKRHTAGTWYADPLLAHTNKVHVATLPYETKRLCQEIGGGMVETGCFPSYEDLKSPEYGEKLLDMIQANPGISSETRARAARLSEWLTIGAGVPGCMHGGGSPDGAKLIIRTNTPIEEYVGYARRLAGIKEEVPEVERKKA
jgi:4-hydroxybutyryl-CoA dehydratase/vinylacetyl-CoA-Delta-isomerase